MQGCLIIAYVLSKSMNALLTICFQIRNAAEAHLTRSELEPGFFMAMVCCSRLFLMIY